MDVGLVEVVGVTNTNYKSVKGSSPFWGALPFRFSDYLSEVHIDKLSKFAYTKTRIY